MPENMKFVFHAPQCIGGGNPAIMLLEQHSVLGVGNYFRQYHNTAYC
jgi:hypothetical protein